MAEATLSSRAQDVSKLICANPGGYDQLFSPAFRAAISNEQISAIFKNLFSTAGPCVSVQAVGVLGTASGTFSFAFKNGGSSIVEIAIDAQAPHLITSCLIKPIQNPAKSFDEVIAKIKDLPGNASLFAVELKGSDLKPLAEWSQNKPMAIGSAFKLYVLAKLVGEIEAGQRHWEDVVHLTENARSLPSGFLQTWPVNSPITLHTLASLMISQSDNTATDQLIQTLGREKIESILAEVGQANPQLNEPFLTTLEMFKLKGAPAKKAADAYVWANAESRRAMLDGFIAKMNRDAIVFPKDPSHVADIEWFASTADLARAMLWLKTHSEKSPADQARGVLSINPGLALSAKTWSYIGYKGGSEPGVLNLTFLLQSAVKPHRWFVMAATWNDPQHAVNEAVFLELVSQAIELTAKS